MTTLEATLTLDLESLCINSSHCSELAYRLHKQLGTPKYTQGVALMRVPGSLEEWQAEHRTARKRAWRAERLGYRFEPFDRSRYTDDIHEINTSLPERQGRPMSDGYLTRRQQSALPEYPCDRHRLLTFGILERHRLRAYLTLYRVGDLALISMILGHGGHLRSDIMYLLAAGMIENQAGQGGWFYYNRYDSGTDGLRYYKQRIGFEARDISWRL